MKCAETNDAIGRGDGRRRCWRFGRRTFNERTRTGIGFRSARGCSGSVAGGGGGGEERARDDAATTWSRASELTLLSFTRHCDGGLGQGGGNRQRRVYIYIFIIRRFRAIRVHVWYTWGVYRNTLRGWDAYNAFLRKYENYL